MRPEVNTVMDSTNCIHITINKHIVTTKKFKNNPSFNGKTVIFVHINISGNNIGGICRGECTRYGPRYTAVNSGCGYSIKGSPIICCIYICHCQNVITSYIQDSIIPTYRNGILIPFPGFSKINLVNICPGSISNLFLRHIGIFPGNRFQV